MSPRSQIVAGRIVTTDPERPHAQALGVTDGRIVVVGDLDEVRVAMPAGTTVRTVAGQIVPGLIDAHLHLQRIGLKMLRMVDEGLGVDETLTILSDRRTEPVWPPGQQPTVEERVAALRRVQPLVHALGMTSVVDPAVTNEEMRGYQEAWRQGALTARIVAMPYPEFGLERAPGVPDAVRSLGGLGLSTGFGDEQLRLGGVKLYFDGEGRRADALLEAPWPGRDDHGHQRLSEPEFEEIVTFCASRRWSVGVHAVGGGAVRTVLEVFERVNRTWPVRELRFQLIHAYLEPSAASIALAARLGVVASLQPSIAWKNGAALHETLGERARTINPTRQWLDAGVVVALGSDGPAFDFDPRLLMWQARTRQFEGRQSPLAPEEALSGIEALAAYTRDAAFASFAEDCRGSLTAGRQADWTALSVDPSGGDPEALLTAETIETVVAGRQVFRGATEEEA